MSEEIITSPDTLRHLVKDGHFFNFCCAVALNKGYKDAMKNKEPVSFTGLSAARMVHFQKRRIG